MCIKYDTFFENDFIKIDTQIAMGNNMPMNINGIMIETDGFEVLSIDEQEKYSAEQLKIFDFDINHWGIYVLKNYHLRTTIPIEMIEKNSGEKISEKLFIEMDDKNNQTTTTLKILDKEIVITDFYILEGFEKLYEEIHKEYTVKICAFCKNLCWNLYGGVDFFNCLCFKEFADEYYKIDENYKMNILKLMEKNKDKYKFVHLTNCCGEYIERHIIEYGT
jgi:hypothetical protein